MGTRQTVLAVVILASVRAFGQLPGSVTARVEWGRRQFVAAALDLDANVIADQRVDIRSELALSISRYFEMWEAVGLDLSLTGTLLRNQSNDDYNDYSASGISFSIGLGF